jgi:hypothetical protein
MPHTSKGPLAQADANAGIKLWLLIVAYSAACCASLVWVVKYTSAFQIARLDTANLVPALALIAPLLLIAALFCVSRFSFGYFIGFGFYTMILGYLALARFSLLNYDHWLGGGSALLSLVAFLLPALFITTPFKRPIVLSRTALSYLLTAILALTALVVAIGAVYNFRVLGFEQGADYRVQIGFPGALRYAFGILADAVLPFVFACYLARGDRWRAALPLLLLLLLYPVTLLKSMLFEPAWLVLLALLARQFEARTVVVLSLFAVVLPGVLLGGLYASNAISFGVLNSYFGVVNFRMIAIPSIVLDLYSDFFSRHDVTHFCQVTFLKPLLSCPRNDLQFLATSMANAYPFGYANGSLFATEGVASVGFKFAPLAALGCGLVIALGNCLSAGLPARFILVSGGMLWEVFLNIPLTTSLLSHGAAMLFLLWYLTPRDIFDDKAPAARV